MFNLSLRNVRIPLADQAALKKALEESLKLLELKQTYAQEQQFPSSSNEKYTRLHAAIRSIFPREATRSIGNVSFPSPISLPLEAKLFTSDGREYAVKKAITNAKSALLESLLSGSEQNLLPGEVLILFSPVGFVTEGTVGADGIVGGSEAESIESLKQRIIARWRENSEYGSTQNYYEWIAKTRIVKTGIFPNYPLPGFISWTGLAEAVGGTYVLPTPEIEAEIQKQLDELRPPAAKVFFLRESRLTLINLSIKIQIRITEENVVLLLQSIRKLFFEKTFAKGAAEFEEILPLSENLVRLTIFQQLGDNNPFEITLNPLGKLGSENLDIGEYLLLGEVKIV